MSDLPDSRMLLDVVGKISAAGGDSVLIGGMAVDLYRNLYALPSLVRNLTKDVDYFGGRVAIDDAASALLASGEDVKEYIADLDDRTPNSGKLAIRRPGSDPIEVDFLYRIDNISADDIESMALSIVVDGKTIRVVHPALLLEMKIGNLAYYPIKRNEAGIDQARIAVACAGRFLETLAAERQRTILKLAERILRFSLRDEACYARHFHQLDAAAAVTETVADLCGEQFKEKRLPGALEQIEKRQTRFDAMVARIRAAGQRPEGMRFR